MPKTNKIRSSTVSDQIVLHLKDAFLNGEYHDGEQLPSVSDLAGQFGVSVSSVREALKKLEALELVEIMHGRGVFVRSMQMHWQAKFTSFSERVRQWGRIPGARLLEIDTRPANTHVAAQLSLSEGSPVHYLRRLRLADDEPLAIEDAYLPADRFPTLPDVYRDPMSLYQLLQTEYGVRPVAGLQTLEAVLVSGDDSRLLGVAPNSPALVMSTIAYDASSVPVEFGNSLFRGDKYRYVVKLTR